MKIADLIQAQGGLPVSLQSARIWERIDSTKPEPRRSRQSILRASVKEYREDTTARIFAAGQTRTCRKKPHLSHGTGNTTYVGEVRTGVNSCVVCHKNKYI